MSKEAVAMMTGDTMRQELGKLLNSKPMIDRAIRLGTSALNNPDPRNMLPKCTPASISGAFIKSVQLNLEPNTVLGECYLIPRFNKDNSTWEANFELGYKGLIKLAYRSGEIKLIQAHEVYENDLFDADYGESKLLHKPYLKGDRGNVVAYWARYILKDGTSDFSVWSVDQIERHRDQYSKSANAKKGAEYSPWNTAFDQMAKKTVIKDCLRYASLSVDDMRVALAVDQTVIATDNKALLNDGKTSTLDVFSKPMQPQIEDSQTEDTEEEKQRMEVFTRVEAKIAARLKNGQTEQDIEQLIAMKLSDVEKQPIDKLILMMKNIS